MKKWISFLLAAVLVLGLCPQPVQAAQIVAYGNCGAEGDNVTWTMYDDGLLTISGTGSMRNYVYGSFYKLNPTRVVIESGVTYIGDFAFEQCYALTDVQLPDTVTYIGSGAFFLCSQLSGIRIPESVTKISNDAFRGCSRLADVKLPAGLIYIGDKAFQGCAMTEMVIPEGVTSLGESTFESCKNLASVTLPQSLTHIYTWAFRDCDNLTRVEIPAGVSYLGDRVFSACDNLTQIVVDENNADFSDDGRGALYNKDGTTLIQVPGGATGEFTVADGVETIGGYAFYQCNSITGVSIPEGVTTIKYEALESMEELAWVKIPASVTDIGFRAFWFCEKLTDIYFGGTKNQWDQFEADMFNGDVTIHYGSDKEPTRPERPEVEYLLEQEWDALARLNRERFQAGTAALCMSEQQMQMAGIRAEELAERFENKRPDGRNFNTVAGEVGYKGYTAMQEKIASGHLTGEAAVEEWLGTSTGRSALVNKLYKHAGVGYAAPEGNTDAPFWSLILIQVDKWKCFMSDFQVCINAVTVEKGTDLGDLKLWATVDCANCGTCYLPILPEYFENYDPNTLGEQAVTVSDGSWSDRIKVTVVDPDATQPDPEPEPDPKPDQPAPDPVTSPSTGCGLTGEEVIESILAQKTRYPEGLSWTDNNSYFWNINNTMGYGCAAFAFILSDAAFGTLPSRTLYNVTISDLRVGDILRMNNDAHSAVVLEVYGDHVVLAEGNYNSSVHWGRVYTSQEIASSVDYAITRYPEHVFCSGICAKCGAREDGSEPTDVKNGNCGDHVTWSLSQDGILTISGTGAMWDHAGDYPGWYRYKDQILQCVIEEGVTVIGGEAFRDCFHLTHVTIPVSVTEIRDGAFSGCYALTDLRYGGTVDQKAEISISLADNDYLRFANVHTDVSGPVSVESIPDPTPALGTGCGMNETAVYNLLAAQKMLYPQGSLWTNNNAYQWNINNTTGTGCFAFAYRMSDMIFGNLPSRMITGNITMDDLRVGDIVYVGKSTVVLEIHDDYIVLAEGSYNNQIHWGRVLTAEEVARYVSYVYTRYPAHTFANGVCTGCGAVEDKDEPQVNYGDCNGDGKVNGLDLILLRQYLADWEVSPDLAAADCNGDGKVNGLDLILLRQYLAAWDVTLGTKNT